MNNAPRFEVIFYDDEDRRAHYAVVEWTPAADGSGRTGRTIERHKYLKDAESAAAAYALIHAFA